jgi:hypothetical protein
MCISKLGPVPDLGAMARKRRNDFGSIKEAADYFRSRGIFTSWTDEMVRLYATFGLKPKSTGRYELKCNPDTGEGRFFDSAYQIPGGLEMLAKIKIPVVLLKGALTQFVGVWREEHAQYLMQKCFPTQRLIVMEEMGHLGLMEKPSKFTATLHKVRIAYELKHII